MIISRAITNLSHTLSSIRYKYGFKSFCGMIGSHLLPAANKRRFNTFCRISNTGPAYNVTGSSWMKCLYKQVHPVQTLITHYSTTESDNNVTYEEIIQGKKSGAIILIDVREQSEIAETGKLPGSIHIPLNDVASALGTMAEEEFKRIYGVQKPGLDAPLVFSCRSGVRSKKAMESVLKMGFKNARNYGGGFLDWADKSK